jgi:large subunit ribosomal protein L15
MDLGSLEKPKGATKQRKRVGRGPGSGTGKTSGRGHKGQLSRSGAKKKAWREGGQMPLHRRLPKKGFRSTDPTRYQVVNIGQLAAKFGEPAEINPEKMKSVGLINTLNRPVKVLGNGDIEVACTVLAQAFSGTAKRKLEAAGGKVEII